MRTPASEDISNEVKEKIHDLFSSGQRIADVKRIFPEVSMYRVQKEHKLFKTLIGQEHGSVSQSFNVITTEQLTDWRITVNNLKDSVKKAKTGSYVTKSGLGFKVVNKI
jgi:hypothetical protein